MAVGIYTEPNPDTLLSEDDLFTRPFAVTFDGRVGGYKEIKLYLRNDDPTFYYTNLVLGLEDSNDEPIISRPEDGYVWKLHYGDLKPTYNDWLAKTPAAPLSNIDDLGESGDPDTSTYLPFWVYIQIPSNTDVQVFTSVKFTLAGTETLA
jgi:hypothetical protein